MRKVGVLGIVIVLVLTAVVAGTAGARSTPEAADAPELAYMNIIFDGYCDGLSGNFSTATGLFAGTYTSSCATCPFTDPVAGTIAKIYGTGQGNGLTLAWQTMQGSPPWLWTVVRFNHTWTHYGFDGTVFNSGTWSKCPKAPVPGAMPSTAR